MIRAAHPSIPAGEVPPPTTRSTHTNSVCSRNSGEYDFILSKIKENQVAIIQNGKEKINNNSIATGYVDSSKSTTTGHLIYTCLDGKEDY